MLRAALIGVFVALTAGPAVAGPKAPARAAPRPAAAAPSDDVRAIEQTILRAHRSAGRPAPARDPLLTAAAQALARRALADGPKAAAAAEPVTAAVSQAGGYDPHPRVIAMRSAPPDRAHEAVAARPDLASSPATHFGIGVAKDARSAAVVLLFAQRQVELAPFPRTVAVGDDVLLSGKLAMPLYDARIFVTGPRRIARAGPDTSGPRNRVATRVEFPDPGLYTVEVVAASANGPQVVALFRVQAGKARAAPAAATEEPERADLAKAEAQVLRALNRTRQARGLRPLGRSSLLDSVADAHAHEMVRLNYFAHVSPRTGDVAQRVSSAGFRYLKVAENLGEADSALQAHLLIEGSPGHLANVIDPELELVGLGTARVKRGTVENVVLVEVFGLQAR